MDDPYAVDRRAFLKTGAVAAAATTAACGGPTSSWRALTQDEARTLAAACDQIVPPDDDPGAAEAGVVVFIDRQLATRDKESLPVWRAGIRGLEATARRKHARAFSELPFHDQTALLRDVEKGAVDGADWEGIEPRTFFGLLRSHTMMGFYGDPRHGGNRERAAWKMLGLEDPPIRGRLHEPPAPAVPATANGATPPEPPATRGAAPARTPRGG